MNTSICKKKLLHFINYHKQVFNSLEIESEWESTTWNVRNWTTSRYASNNLIFTCFNYKKKDTKDKMSKEYTDFIKAFAIYIQRKRDIKFSTLRNYIKSLRIIYNIMKTRNEESLIYLTRWHFDEALLDLKTNMIKIDSYNAAANLKAIADTIDDLQITYSKINYIHSEKPQRYYFNYKELAEINSNDIRINNDKLPSNEALLAYAQCTNNPLNDSEAIILRTIDLLIATGQRVNEITFIPFKCLVKVPQKDQNNNNLLNSEGDPIINWGIRYYPEKNMSPRIHWLAESDVPLALRAVQDLKRLTRPIRAVAKFQEKHKKLWKYNSDDIVSDSDLLEYLHYESIKKLHFSLSHKKIAPHHQIKTKNSQNKNKTITQKFYRAGDIEDLYTHKINDHIALKEGDNIILKTSEILSITFDNNSSNKIFPRKIIYQDIAIALGGNKDCASIFSIRGLTEADGSRIKIRSHQLRHWRNTIYELGGMSNVNQAIAMGRQLLNQNVAYHHPTLKEHTEVHKDYLKFNNLEEKVDFLKTGIIENRILGHLTETYHDLKLNKGDTTAELFLKTFANTLHITPYGICTNDFSLQPCPLHLECWNSCSNLHMTGSDHEVKNITELIIKTEENLTLMQEEKGEEFGIDRFSNRLERQLENMKRALELAKKGENTKVFPEGKDLSLSNKKTDVINGK